MLPDSSTNLIIAMIRQCTHSIKIEVDYQKQQTCCLDLDFAIANLFMTLVVSISQRRSCSILLGIKLYSLFNGDPLFILPS